MYTTTDQNNMKSDCDRHSVCRTLGTRGFHVEVCPATSCEQLRLVCSVVPLWTDDSDACVLLNFRLVGAWQAKSFAFAGPHRMSRKLCMAFAAKSFPLFVVLTCLCTSASASTFNLDPDGLTGGALKQEFSSAAPFSGFLATSQQINQSSSTCKFAAFVEIPHSH